MKQQINLYQPIFRAQRKVFSALALLQVCVAVLAGLLLIYGYGRWQIVDLEKALARLEVQQVASVQRVEELNQRFAVKAKDPRLESEIAQLGTQIAGKQTVLQSFAGNAAGNTTGFSKYLEGLAQQHLEGMWLTGITISEGGRVLTLTGSTLAPELVPAFLQQLSKEPVFAGIEFKTLVMERPQTDTARVDFTLQTTEAPLKSQGAEQSPSAAIPAQSLKDIAGQAAEMLKAISQP